MYPIKNESDYLIPQVAASYSRDSFGRIESLILFAPEGMEIFTLKRETVTNVSAEYSLRCCTGKNTFVSSVEDHYLETARLEELARATALL